jgi:Secretion system C-terminal sorting domain
MKKQMLLIVLFLLFSSKLFPQNSWIRIYQSPGIPIDNFKKVHVSESEKLIFIQHELEYNSTNPFNGEVLEYLENQNIWVMPFNNFLTHSCNPIELRCTAVNFFTVSNTNTNYVLKYHESSWSSDPDARTYVSPDAGLTYSQNNNFACGGTMLYPTGGDISPSDNSIWYYGYPGLYGSNVPKIYKSFDYGETWTPLVEIPDLRSTSPIDTWSSLSGGFIKINPFNTDYIFVVHRDYMMLSTDGGYNFSSINIPPLKELAFDYTNNIIYGVARNKIYKSMDNGLTWGSSDVPFNLNTLEVSPDNNNIIYAGTETGLYRSSNQGVSWYHYNNSFTPSINVIGLSKELNTGDTIIVCTKDGVYKVFHDFLVGVVSSNNSIPNSYNLEQNFPNPFNPSTKIKFGLMKPGFTSLKIYDALGREVSNLVNNILPAGAYEIEFNASDYSSGIYYYKIISGEFQDTRKMILTK